MSSDMAKEEREKQGKRRCGTVRYGVLPCVADRISAIVGQREMTTRMREKVPT